MENVFVCTISELPLNKMKHFQVGFKYEIVLYWDGAVLYAFQRGCPHKGWPLDAHGEIFGTTLSCVHGYRFDLLTGSSLSVRPICPKLTTYRATITDEEIYVWVPDDYLYEYIN